MSSPSDAQRYNSRLGLWLCGLYTLFYLGFVLLSALAASTMEIEVIAGLNLAIVYGFALIVIAIAMALLYGVLCRSEPPSTVSKAPSSKAPSASGSDKADSAASGEDGGIEA